MTDYDDTRELEAANQKGMDERRDRRELPRRST